MFFNKVDKDKKKEEDEAYVEVPADEKQDDDEEELPKAFALKPLKDEEENAADIQAEAVKTSGNDAEIEVEVKNGNPEVAKKENCCALEKKNCCALALDISIIVCLFLMSIFFICGTAFIHPNNYVNGPDDPGGFIIVGSMLYIAVVSMDIVKRKSKGIFQIVNGSIAILAGLLWFVGSIFLLRDVGNSKAWGGLWIVGSLLNLYVVTCDLVKLFMNQRKPLFRAIALALAWLANLLFLGGASHLISYVLDLEAYVEAYYGYYDATDANVNECDADSSAGILISGAVMFFLHSIFELLALIFKDFIFSVSRSAP
jgi:hypothetical protein